MTFMLNPFLSAAAAETDPSFANVVLLTNFDGVDTGTSFADDSNSAHTLTAQGSAQTDTDVLRFGEPTLLCNGYVKSADSDDWTFGSGDFTVEGWYYLTGSTGVQRALVAQFLGGGNRGWYFFLNGSANLLQAAFSTSGSNTITVNSHAYTATQFAWTHFVWERSGNTFRVYANGSMVGKATNTSTLVNSTSQLEIGAYANGSQQWAGNIFDVRITKGVARYDSDSGYTVPTAPFPRS